MYCHYCDREAAVAVKKDHLEVGVCERHLRERMEEIADADWLDAFEAEVDDALDR